MRPVPCRPLLVLAVLVVPLAGCSLSVAERDEAPRPRVSASAAPTGTPTPTAPAEPTGVHGLPYGEIPPVPLIAVPDLSALDDAQAAVDAAVRAAVASLPGLSVTPARCDAAGELVVRDGAVLYGDGSGTFVGPDGTVVAYGDGSGTATSDGSTTTNYGDGSGTYADGDVSIVNYGDGSGSYTDATRSVTVYGDGSGALTDGTASIVNYGDGSGTWTDGTESVTNHGDGSGTYSGPTTSIVNHGDGTGLVDGVPVEMDPLPPVPRMGVFPPLAALEPVAPVCGSLVTLPASVLFDFGRHELRPEAGAVLDAVVTGLTAAGVAGTVEVHGHTDSVSDDAFNQALSERRAAAVVDGLEERGLGAPLVARGFGETRPVAPNEVEGQDDPAGRQLNRRVEIFVPAG
ncbi:OmpA family protein [Actinotalea solisilvae]|uniref:OmpA family protein n=1 Tax=Actinotalea solisilvae TaxID=2072922 RepID=UPI0027DEA357|nr:OmpA family protein [Actinotalea solisilvae]